MKVINFRLNRVNYKLAGTFLLLMLITAAPIGLFSLTEQEKLIRSEINYIDAEGHQEQVYTNAVSLPGVSIAWQDDDLISLS